MTFCLDSWAVLRWLEGAEPAASRVDEVIAERPVMSWINAGEVFYVLHRLAGPDEARRTVSRLRGLLRLDVPGPERIIAAATIKAAHPLAYADAFAIATALAHRAILMTGDPELIYADLTWPVEDLRPGSSSRTP